MGDASSICIKEGCLALWQAKASFAHCSELELQMLGTEETYNQENWWKVVGTSYTAQCNQRGGCTCMQTPPSFHRVSYLLPFSEMGLACLGWGACKGWGEERCTGQELSSQGFLPCASQALLSTALPLQAGLPLAKRPMEKYCRRPRYRATTHHPLSCMSPCPPRPCAPHHSCCQGAEPWMSRRHLDLENGTSTWSAQREGRSLLDRDFLQAHRPVLWQHRGRQDMQTYCPQAPQRPEDSLGKTRKRLKALCRVSWGQKLIPHMAQMETCAASLPVGTGVRITSALI